MRKILGLALTLSLGLTAIMVVPAAAHAKDDDCTNVRTWSGWDCLDDRELDWYRTRDRLSEQDLRSMVDCECLSSSDRRYLETLAKDADRRDIRRILRYMYEEDCFTEREFLRLRRGFRSIDEDDVKAMIKKGADCDSDRKFRGRGWRWFLLRDRDRDWDWDWDWDRDRRDKDRRHRDRCERITNDDLRRIDRRAKDLDLWEIRSILRLDDRDCVRDKDIRRLGKRSDHVGYIEVYRWLMGGLR